MLFACVSVHAQHVPPSLDLSGLRLGGDMVYPEATQQASRMGGSSSSSSSSKSGRTLLEDTPQGPPPIRPKIYIYELPERLRNASVGDVTDTFYGLEQLFPELLLASHHVTKNGNEADFFYVNAWLSFPKTTVRDIVAALQEAGPWWDAKQGADHIFVHSGEKGRCDFTDTEQAIKSVLIHHFGLLQNTHRPICNLDEVWGAHCDDEMIVSEAAMFGRPVIQDACHLPGQDIVVPPSTYEFHPGKPHTWTAGTPYLNDSLKGLPRTDMLFYSGKIDLDADDPELSKNQPWHDARYSLGARQSVYKMFKKAPGFLLLNHHSHDDYYSHLSTSVFCLATAGWGWGGRMKAAVTRGCIPVIVQDGILVEFEEQLPLKEYAIRVPLWMSHKLPPILAVFNNTGHVANMQKALECTWRLHWWRRPYGRAFEVVMCELKRRVLKADRIKLDTDECTLDCGDGHRINLLKEGPMGV
ncbi:hypothetical protein FOA52_000816 [Chlamydomonas sp. UWO 241]|nr:hypothetical protein FOA52_000816 [Chlamydomonas sp. UWO 241]